MKLKSIISLFLALALAVTLCGCTDTSDPEALASDEVPVSNDATPAQGDIVILYTNDIHCGYNEGLGFASLAAMKQNLLETTPYVSLVDCGDAIQGEVIGTISQGEYIIDMMNKVGYDLAVFGNHEFDFGIPQLSDLIDRAEFSYLACNISYYGSGEFLLADIEPYHIETYGDISVAFIGVTTPETLTSSSPKNFMEDNAYVYSFSEDDNGAELFTCVQGYVDECRDAGADYVVLLSHLGDPLESSVYNTTDLIAATTGIDVVLDAHTHSVIPCQILSALDGREVLLSSTGTKLENIGKLVISANGQLTTTLISAYPETDDETQAFIDDIEAAHASFIEETVATTDVTLHFSDDDGIRLVRNRETTIGNFCADAYRYVTGADVAIVNGGGIRTSLEAGDITYADLISVHPFGNTICMIETTGQEILDTLEITSRAVQAEYAAGGNALGEEGGFLSVSGMRYTVDTSIPSSVVFDGNDMFLAVDGERRVTNVEILNDNGEYVPIDPNAEYTLASHNYIIKDGGSNNPLFMDNKLLIDGGLTDYQVLYTYLVDVLGGELGMLYSDVEGRINIH